MRAHVSPQPPWHYCRATAFVAAAGALFTTIGCDKGIIKPVPGSECPGTIATSAGDLASPPAGTKQLAIESTIDLTTDVAVPSGVDLCFGPTGMLRIAEGITLRFAEEVEAERRQIFTYLGEASAVIGASDKTVSPEWWGAFPGDTLNDTAPLRYVGRFIADSDGGTIDFSKGDYVVGSQTPAGSAPFPLAADPVLDIRGASQPVNIVGNNARFVADEGLLFGYFDQATGDPVTPSTCGANSPNAANAYSMINVERNESVTIQGFALDGNIGKAVLGGECADGRQLFAYGIRAYNNESLNVSDIYTHHHGTDGMVIGFEGLMDSDPPKPHVVDNLVSEYNGRQGLSWVGGNDLRLTNCELNHTGRAEVSSPPGAGLDIEAENAVVRGGIIDGCIFLNNTGPGVVADSSGSVSGYTTIRNSTMWGTTTWSLLVRTPGIVFEDCFVHGSVPNLFGSADPALATRFTRCRFEDTEYPGLGVFRSNGGLMEVDNENLLIEDSEFVAHKTHGIWLDGTNSREILRNVTITHANRDRADGEFQSLLRGADLTNVHFKEGFTPPPHSTPVTAGWYISVGPNLTYSNVCVDGPWVGWTPARIVGCPVP